MGRKGCFLIFEQMRSLEQDLTFLSAKTEFDESNIPFKEKNLGIQNQDGIYTNINDNLNMYINDHLRMYTSDYALI